MDKKEKDQNLQEIIEQFELLPSQGAVQEDIYEDDDSHFEEVSIEEIAIPRKEKINDCNYYKKTKSKSTWEKHENSQANYISLFMSLKFTFHCEYCRCLSNTTFDFYAFLSTLEHIDRHKRVAQLYRAPMQISKRTPMDQNHRCLATGLCHQGHYQTFKKLFI